MACFDGLVVEEFLLQWNPQAAWIEALESPTHERKAALMSRSGVAYGRHDFDRDFQILKSSIAANSLRMSMDELRWRAIGILEEGTPRR